MHTLVPVHQDIMEHTVKTGNLAFEHLSFNLFVNDGLVNFQAKVIYKILL